MEFTLIACHILQRSSNSSGEIVVVVPYRVVGIITATLRHLVSEGFSLADQKNKEEKREWEEGKWQVVDLHLFCVKHLASENKTMLEILYSLKGQGCKIFFFPLP